MRHVWRWHTVCYNRENYIEVKANLTNLSLPRGPCPRGYPWLWDLLGTGLSSSCMWWSEGDLEWEDLELPVLWRLLSGSSPWRLWHRTRRGGEQMWNADKIVAMILCQIHLAFLNQFFLLLSSHHKYEWRRSVTLRYTLNPSAAISATSPLQSCCAAARELAGFAVRGRGNDPDGHGFLGGPDCGCDRGPHSGCCRWQSGARSAVRAGGRASHVDDWCRRGSPWKALRGWRENAHAVLA